MTYTFTAIFAGHARLLQRHAGRPAGRDGALRRDHRAADEPSQQHVQSGVHATNLASRKAHWHEIRFPAGGMPRTTIPTPATTANTCSSSPRWIRAFTAGGSAGRSQRETAAGVRAAVSMLPTEPYHPAYFMINGRSMPDDMDPQLRASSTRTSPTTAIRTCIRAN